MVSTGKHFNFDGGLPFPSSDPSIWNVDEDDVLTFDDLYGMDPLQQDNSASSIPNLNQPLHSSIPNMLNNCPVQFSDIKPQFQMTSMHTASMPVLPIQNQHLAFGQMTHGTSHHNVPMQQEVAMPQEVPNYGQLSHFPTTNSLKHLPVQTVTSETPGPQYSPTTEAAMVTFVDLNQCYEKGQCRLQGKSEQRLDYANSFVRIYLAQPDDIKAKAVYVERSPDAAHILKDNVGRVPLKVLPDESDSWMKVNLDDAGSEVYKLSKVKGEERNRFRIVVELLFRDTNQRKMYHSDTFQVKSKPKSTDQLFGDAEFEDGEKPVKIEPDLKKKPVKRQRIDELDCMIPSPASVGSSIFPEVITDHLRATTAEIDQLKIIQPIQTQRGDIAYNFKLKDAGMDLEEGDVVGFFENGNGNTEIRPLTCENIHQAKSAGVISRSAWLEGKTPGPDENDETDLVCVSGIVKVKVRGPVKNGETIYASLSSFPGVAMPESVITQVTSNELTMLGQALETTDSPPDKVNLVSCLVSIFLGIQGKHTTKAVNEVRSGVMVDVDTKVKKEKKKLLRGLRWKTLALLIFCGLLAFMLYQFFAPLTAYRYWKCRQGSISGSTSAFTFQSFNLQFPRVNGIEFHFDDLMDKLEYSRNTERKSDDGIRSNGYRYYLNIDRCAAGGLKAGVQGPELYVINDECNAAYYLHGPHGYKRYKSGTHFECSFTPSCAVCPAVYKNHKPLRVKLRRKFRSCSRGIKRDEGNPSYAYFRYTPSSNTSQVRTVTGVEVELALLSRKQNVSLPKFPDKNVEVRYYYNLDHCVWGLKMNGPDFFAIADKCDNAHYHSDGTNKWKKYRSDKEHKCLPPF